MFALRLHRLPQYFMRIHLENLFEWLFFSLENMFFIYSYKKDKQIFKHIFVKLSLFNKLWNETVLQLNGRCERLDLFCLTDFKFIIEACINQGQRWTGNILSKLIDTMTRPPVPDQAGVYIQFLKLYKQAFDPIHGKHCFIIITSMKFTKKKSKNRLIYA